jgi:hypothetical protein
MHRLYLTGHFERAICKERSLPPFMKKSPVNRFSVFFAAMKNTAVLYLVISIAVFYFLGMQRTQGAWWGKPTFGFQFLWRQFGPIFISFAFSVLACFRSFKQIRQKQYNLVLNWFTLIAGMLLGLYTGIISVEIVRTYLSD